MTGQRLVDGEVMQREFPDAFRIPPRALRVRVPPGWRVKVGFYTPPGSFATAERMWLRVTGRSDRGYVGELLSNSLETSLKRGAVVRFAVRHILDIEDDAGAGDER